MDIYTKERIDNLTWQLNKWTKAYDMGKPEVSDKIWDDSYFELQKLEKEWGYINPLSPTQHIIFEEVAALKKVTHNHPMLSLDKTKDLNEVKSFLDDHDYIAMCKMDGLTCSLTYKGGKLIFAETRGNGEVGEDILHNTFAVATIPQVVEEWTENPDNEIVIDGEIICTYDDFRYFSDEYKNPRNFASGSIRLLNSEECAHRLLTFVAWDVIKGFSPDTCDLLSDRLTYLAEAGFTVVPFLNPSDDLERLTISLQELAQDYSYPIDGVVFKFNSKKYGDSLGATGHHFRNAIAYKFYDETVTSELQNIDWTMGRTGVLTPVAVFNPIEIEGTEVERANMHNISVMESLLTNHPFIGQEVQVYKANQIIPQIAAAAHPGEGVHLGLSVPKICPICGGETKIINRDGVKVLMCDNPNCEGKLVNRLDHFCGKKGLDIKGLSKATLEKLIDWGWVETFRDILRLHEHKKEWIAKPGFGEASVNKILTSIHTATHPAELWRVISAAGIPLIGVNTAKQLANTFKTYAEFCTVLDEDFDFTVLPDIGEITSEALLGFDYTEINDAVWYGIEIASVKKQSTESSSIEGKSFVITGKVHIYKNRDEIKEKIESLGGKVTGSVTSKTDYLINNDVTSTTAKNNKAKELGIPIISEEDFQSLIGA